MAPKSIGIVANPHKERARESVCVLRDSFLARGLEVVVARETAEHCRLEGEDIPLAEPGHHSDLIVVLGGDGSMLHAVHAMGEAIQPLAAINMGRLGFLTCATSDEQESFVDLLVNGEFVMSRRSTIMVEITEASGESATLIGLNEAVIGRGNSTRMIGLQVFIDGQFVNHYAGDGLIIATPTGSTAYSLSAGGPIISPESNVFLMTPICSHALSNRSIVISDGVEITIAAEDLGVEETVMSVDGRARQRIHEGTSITLRRGPYDVPLVMTRDYRFYAVLQQKLGWRGSNLREPRCP